MMLSPFAPTVIEHRYFEGTDAKQASHETSCANTEPRRLVE
jgi:hypothetical protein